tara:strand:- start:4858 stop:5328 length:471 start_codon:yes stop_codon:yes gene_type:complete
MKAIEINGQIKKYDRLPKSWGNVLGGFDLLSDEQLKTYGFYDVVIPDYDVRIQELGDLYFDSASETFTKDVSNRTWTQTLAELKEQQINNFKDRIKGELAKTDWYVIRNQEIGDAIPADITSAREELRNQADTVESEINSKSNKANVMSYDFPSFI